MGTGPCENIGVSAENKGPVPFFNGLLDRWFRASARPVRIRYNTRKYLGKIAKTLGEAWKID